MSLAVISAIIMTVLLIVMLVMGASISIAIGLSSAVAMLCMLPVDISLITSAQRIFTGANSFSLIAIPFFILAGNIMNNGGIAVRLVNVAKVLSGRMPGALAQSNVVANMIDVYKRQALASSQTSMIPFVAAGLFYYVFNLIVAVVMEYTEKKLSYYQ